jgi:hypothetical protein
LCKQLIMDSSRLETDWEYFRLPPPEQLHLELIPHGDSEGMVEPVLISEDYYASSVINTEFNGKPGYTTGDLLQEHPTAKGFYRIYGRADEQIMLSTGEKTNPVPLG